MLAARTLRRRRGNGLASGPLAEYSVPPDQQVRRSYQPVDWLNSNKRLYLRKYKMMMTEIMFVMLFPISFFNIWTHLFADVLRSATLSSKIALWSAFYRSRRTLQCESSFGKWFKNWRWCIWERTLQRWSPELSKFNFCNLYMRCKVVL